MNLLGTSAGRNTGPSTVAEIKDRFNHEYIPAGVRRDGVKRRPGEAQQPLDEDYVPVPLNNDAVYLGDAHVCKGIRGPENAFVAREMLTPEILKPLAPRIRGLPVRTYHDTDATKAPELDTEHKVGKIMSAKAVDGGIAITVGMRPTTSIQERDAIERVKANQIASVSLGYDVSTKGDVLNMWPKEVSLVYRGAWNKTKLTDYRQTTDPMIKKLYDEVDKGVVPGADMVSAQFERIVDSADGMFNGKRFICRAGWNDPTTCEENDYKTPGGSTAHIPDPTSRKTAIAPLDLNMTDAAASDTPVPKEEAKADTPMDTEPVDPTAAKDAEESAKVEPETAEVKNTDAITPEQMALLPANVRFALEQNAAANKTVMDESAATKREGDKVAAEKDALIAEMVAKAKTTEEDMTIMRAKMQLIDEAAAAATAAAAKNDMEGVVDAVKSSPATTPAGGMVTHPVGSTPDDDDKVADKRDATSLILLYKSTAEANGETLTKEQLDQRVADHISIAERAEYHKAPRVPYARAGPNDPREAEDAAIREAKAQADKLQAENVALRRAAALLESREILARSMNSAANSKKRPAPGAPTKPKKVQSAVIFDRIPEGANLFTVSAADVQHNSCGVDFAGFRGFAAEIEGGRMSLVRGGLNNPDDDDETAVRFADTDYSKANDGAYIRDMSKYTLDNSEDIMVFPQEGTDVSLPCMPRMDELYPGMQSTCTNEEYNGYQRIAQTRCAGGYTGGEAVSAEAVDDLVQKGLYKRFGQAENTMDGVVRSMIRSAQDEQIFG